MAAIVNSIPRDATCVTQSADGWPSTDDLINDAINIKYALAATAQRLAELVGRHGSEQDRGMHEALLVCIAALGSKLMDAADSIVPASPH